MGLNDLFIPKLQRLQHRSLGRDKYFHPTLYWVCDNLSMLGLKLNHVSKRGPWKTGLNMFIFHSQHMNHGCWLRNYLGSQGISSHGIDLFYLEYFRFSTTSIQQCSVPIKIYRDMNPLVSDYYIPRIRRIGGCYGFTSKPPAARHLPPAMVLTR